MKIRLQYWPEKYLSPEGDPMKIKLIKAVREFTGYGLREAKDVIDTMFDHCYPEVEVTFVQYRDFVADGWGVKVTERDVDGQLIENCLNIQNQLIMIGKVESAKMMIDVITDLIT